MPESPTRTDSLLAKMKAVEASAIERSRQRRAQESLPFSPDGEPEPPAPEQTAQLIEFPQWPDDRRATAQAVFRSALFPAMNFKEGRPFLKEKNLVSVEGVEVVFTGEQFDQSDLDVYLELLKIARKSPFGTECHFSAYSLLKALRHRTGNKDHKWLHSVLIRLRGGTVDMTDHGIRYFGGLVEGGFKDEITKHYGISINTAFAPLFEAGLWASLNIEQRRDLKRNQTAKALHAYYSTHAAPGPHTFEKLAALIGLTDKNRRKLKMNIKAAHDELKLVGFLSDYEAQENTIRVAINHTPSQARHIVRKVVRARRSRQPKSTG